MNVPFTSVEMFERLGFGKQLSNYCLRFDHPTELCRHSRGGFVGLQLLTGPYATKQ